MIRASGYKHIDIIGFRIMEKHINLIGYYGFYVKTIT